jgi:DNA polymerase elongation subunit (family B)
MNTQPRCLVLDIETSPMKAYVWGRKDVNISVNHILEDWQIIAWSAKWLGEKKIHYRDVRGLPHSPTLDRGILLVLRILLDEADIVITQNGQSFDSRKINARFIQLGISPPSPYRHLDTYRIARRIADFTSFSLEYLSDKLCKKYKKLKHSKFLGMSLWDECLKGNIKAWDEMQRYNIRDTLTTEELYMKLRAWVSQTMPDAHTRFDPGLNCRVCGVKTKMWKKGYEVKNTGRYNRYQCQSCYAWTTGRKA